MQILNRRQIAYMEQEAERKRERAILFNDKGEGVISNTLKFSDDLFGMARDEWGDCRRSKSDKDYRLSDDEAGVWLNSSRWDESRRASKNGLTSSNRNFANESTQSYMELYYHLPVTAQEDTDIELKIKDDPGFPLITISGERR